MPDSFFVDGYTRHATIAERPGLHPALTFSFRPALPEERLVLHHPNTTPERYTALAIDLVARKVVEWSAGEKVSRERVAALEPSLMRDMLDYILGYVVPTEGAAAADKGS